MQLTLNRYWLWFVHKLVCLLRCRELAFKEKVQESCIRNVHRLIFHLLLCATAKHFVFQFKNNLYYLTIGLY